MVYNIINDKGNGPDVMFFGGLEMVRLQYKKFNVYYWERVKDGAYAQRSASFLYWRVAADYISEMIKESDPLDPKGPKYKLDHVEAIEDIQ